MRVDSARAAVDVVVFDIGGVLVDWNPRHLYRGLFAGDEQAMEAFLAGVCSPAWNERQDAGRPWAEAIGSLTSEHPDQADLIAAYRDRWPEMLGGPIPGVPEILAELRRHGIACHGLTNWSGETFPIALERYEFLALLDGIVVSGDERLLKPDPAIFRLLVERCRLTPRRTAYVDDSPANITAAEALGMIGVPFADAAHLRRDLAALGLPVRIAPTR